MPEYAVTLPEIRVFADTPEDAAKEFRAEIVDFAYLYRIEVCEVVPGKHDDGTPNNFVEEYEDCIDLNLNLVWEK